MKSEKLRVYSIMAFLFGCVLLYDQPYADELFIAGKMFGYLSIGIAVMTFVFLMLKQQKVERILYFVHCGVLGGLTTVSLLRFAEGVTNVIWIFTAGIMAMTILMLVRESDNE